jgi:hypothetical protein
MQEEENSLCLRPRGHPNLPIVGSALGYAEGTNNMIFGGESS